MAPSPRSLFLALLSLSSLATSTPLADSHPNHAATQRSPSSLSTAEDESLALGIEARSAKTHKTRPPKYFKEAGTSVEMSHYDKRYFVDEVPYDEHRLVLRDLIRSYLAAMDRFGIETWLAHGTLLGWWWNGKVMPWDYDLDVQVSNATLRWIGDNLNGTEHEYSTASYRTRRAEEDNHDKEEDGVEDEQQQVIRRYLLDVNPHHVDLTKGDGLNIIDGRWIDMANGMFIDITGVRERSESRQGEWSCKNGHTYRSGDLWPMRVSEFEGARARIPYGFEKILSEEYGHGSLVLELYNKHRWDRERKEWVLESDEEEKQRVDKAKAQKLAAMESDKD